MAEPKAKVKTPDALTADTTNLDVRDVGRGRHWPILRRQSYSFVVSEDQPEELGQRGFRGGGGSRDDERDYQEHDGRCGWSRVTDLCGVLSLR